MTASEYVLVVNTLAACRAAYPLLAAVEHALTGNRERIADATVAVARAGNVLQALVDMNGDALVEGARPRPPLTGRRATQR